MADDDRVSDDTIAELMARSQDEIDHPIEVDELLITQDVISATAEARTSYAEALDELRNDLQIGDGEQRARASGGTPPVTLTGDIAAKWRTAVDEAVAYRHLVVQLVQRALRELVSADHAQVQDEARDLSSLEDSLERIAQAAEDNESAKSTAELLLTINKSLEILTEACKEEVDLLVVAVSYVADKLHDQYEDVDATVASGLSRLGDYMVAVQTATEGYGDISQLRSDIESAMKSLGSAIDVYRDHAATLAAANALRTD